MQRFFCIGNVGDNPNITESANGPVVNFSVATTEKYKNKNGELQEKTDWHKLVAFGNNAKNIQNYVKKGTRAHFECRHRSGSYEKEGKKYSTSQFEVISFELLNNKSTNTIDKKIKIESQSDKIDKNDGTPF